MLYRTEVGRGSRKILSRLDLRVKYCQITTYDHARKFWSRLSADAMIGRLSCGRQGQMSQDRLSLLWKMQCRQVGEPTGLENFEPFLRNLAVAPWHSGQSGCVLAPILGGCVFLRDLCRF